ncbi:MFS transporter [Christensenellaceae bacterium OttesenSCG-928-K19]|nr:MFS transporter [Christensenellaceae bacterium OttesenSCG-928-K19]
MRQYTYKNTVHACYLGYITSAIIVNLAPLFFVIFQTDFNVSFEMLGRLVLVGFGTQLLTDMFMIKFADRIGHRRAVLIAHVFCVTGFVMLSVLPNTMGNAYAGILIATVIYSIGGGMIEVLISPIVDAIPGDAKAAAMSLLHSFYSWGQVLVVLVTTLVLYLIGLSLWFVLPIAWAAIPLYNFFLFRKVPLAPTVEEHERIPLKKLMLAKIFILAMLMMICAGAAEQAMSQWASLFAEKGLQVPKVVGDLLGPCLFAVFMGIGRTVYGIKGNKINLAGALIGSSVLCVACYLMATLFHNPFISLIGCALCGLSVSLMWPGMLSFTSASYPKGGTAMFGVLAMCGDIGCSLGPWITGIVSDVAQRSDTVLAWGAKMGYDAEQAGLKIGLLVAIVFPLIMLAGILVMRKLAKKEATQ